jgi:hypothetical protein
MVQQVNIDLEIKSKECQKALLIKLKALFHDVVDISVSGEWHLLTIVAGVDIRLSKSLIKSLVANRIRCYGIVDEGGIVFRDVKEEYELYNTF